MDPSSRRFAQPDARSCGASVLVMAQMLRNPAYAARLAGPDLWRAEVLAMHRRVTSSADVAGRLQAPWPRTLGTPPWAIARQLQGTTGTPYRLGAIWPHRRAQALAEIRAAVRPGLPVPLYVGNRWLPRHVVLVLDAELTTYEPASGRYLRLEAERFVAGAVGLAGWQVPWFSVLPRRTPA
ncbi:hypothetical protein [Nocardioides sp. AE5]|uniref:hypothetical protein n=1 Tax=Nocardioides sp. AE5 TaxID=2962573 RepID=UPI002881BD4D|nr:hypothetical protein [Nocardioides sp. AE5]MDT0201960.1 hypothetical protein [Nocardioides sp. AE5]